jgi:hypothetical protein
MQRLGVETKAANAIANKQPGSKFIVRATGLPECCWALFNSEVGCDIVVLIRNSLMFV